MKDTERLHLRQRHPGGDRPREPDPDLHDLALVTAGYPLEGETGWGLGVLGSTRMEYARVMALVDHVARSLANALEERRT